MRSEQEIFDELASLCASPGYVHAIAYLCWRDNTISYSGEMTAEDMQHLFSNRRLIRTEISTLIGLMLKSPIDYTLPAPPVVERYVESTEALLEEIHHAMSPSFWKHIDPAKIAEEGFNPFTSGAALREPIFYGGESAYSFQYRDFSPMKYANDDHWLIANKGFSIRDAHRVVVCISQVLDEKSNSIMRDMCVAPQEMEALLPGNSFSVQEVADYGHIDPATVDRILSAFAVPPSARNEQFNALDDFNIANASPLIRMPDGNYLHFHIYSLVEALYEAPFYWMGADKAYVSTAMQNRGVFTEQFAAERLRQVFGADNVVANIDIYESKDTKLAEIDVLVLFGNHAIVLQAKSKRLTLEARRGNDLQIKDDFKKSIQDSSDQAYRCAKLIEEGKCSFKDAAGDPVTLPASLKRIYVICLISDHYPALSFQARQFLKFSATDTISPPFVMDVFALDAITEMLSSPLHFLSYVDRRTGYTDKLMASHELTILSYHLKKNLWLEDNYDKVFLDDEISADLDVAMLARREGIPGKRTPEGILTRLSATALGRLVKAIEARPHPATIDLGFMLLTLGEDTVLEVSACMDMLAKRSVVGGKNHDVTVGLDGGTGLTIHFNSDPIDVAGPALERHCNARKYTQHSDSWFGVCVYPKDQTLRFGVNLNFPWKQDDTMDTLTKSMNKSDKPTALLREAAVARVKVGRNDPCPCGSGKKYKKCCLT
ncbi:nuclease-related domain-containing protein [Metallibacterium scheffleri]|uniref:Prepilin peptidase n=1 Tax=Metallibacterium scheffleri TaxID=993689 RepID=A0A4S3KIF9_9GAMM|nr:nuclease-related domain-containing protein [Metallibacterium scheffleri]THD08535.1 prepilin peptidase [Metallibacterium scheffleri]